jgi:hypothetical protein
VGYIENGQLEKLPLNDLAHTPVSNYVEHSSISDSPYIYHSRVPCLVKDLTLHSGFSIDFFDNTLVITFDSDIAHDESTSKEEGKGH